MADPATHSHSNAAIPDPPAQPEPTTIPSGTRGNIISATPRRNITNGGRRNITGLRDQIAEEMDGEFLSYDVTNFMAKYLPFVPSQEDIEQCVATMLEHMDSSEQFIQFPAVPTKADGNEKQIFEPLDDIANAIGKYSLKGRKRNEYHYRKCPDNLIDSGVDGSDNKIDACITSDSEGKLTTTGVAVAVEYKVAPDERYDNNRKVVAANVQIMNDDARRMFTFGITIEADQVTLWHHSRSHSAICESFSFVHQPKLFIKVIMSFLFATGAELGYDPLITLHKDPLGGQDQYTYEIPQKGDAGSHFYRTIKPISEYRSNNITGRMSRIWLVSRTNSTTDPNPKGQFVLKDVWLEAAAKTEKQIQANIFEDIEKAFEKVSVGNVPVAEHPARGKFLSMEDIKLHRANIVQNKEYKKFFLTTLIEYEGQISKAISPEARRTTGLFDRPLKTAPSGKTLNFKSSRKTRSTVGTDHPLPSVRPRQHIDREYVPRKQYRVVFEEVCTTVGDLKNLGDVVNVLRHTLIPLQLMSCAGWVHRDISSGNIMAHKNGNHLQAKLADLEYAKKYPPPPNDIASVDPKTGTPFFMPLEIMKQRLRYDERVAADVHAEFWAGPQPTFSLNSDDTPAIEPTDRNVKDTPKGIDHNFQHDLESLWWLLLWCITARIDNTSPQSKGFVDKVFQNSIVIWEGREKCITDPIYQELDLVLVEPLKPVFPTVMEGLRRILDYHYGTRDYLSLDSSLNSFTAVHSQFERAFEQLLTRSNLWGETPLKNDFRYPQELAPTRNDFVGEETPRLEKPGRRKRARVRDSDAYVVDSDSSGGSEEGEHTGKRQNTGLTC